MNINCEEVANAGAEVENINSVQKPISGTAKESFCNCILHFHSSIPKVRSKAAV